MKRFALLLLALALAVSLTYAPPGPKTTIEPDTMWDDGPARAPKAHPLVWVELYTLYNPIFWVSVMP